MIRVIIALVVILSIGSMVLMSCSEKKENKVDKKQVDVDTITQTINDR